MTAQDTRWRIEIQDIRLRIESLEARLGRLRADLAEAEATLSSGGMVVSHEGSLERYTDEEIIELVRDGGTAQDINLLPPLVKAEEITPEPREAAASEAPKAAEEISPTDGDADGDLTGLNARQVRMVMMVRDGKTDAEIAEALGYPPNSVSVILSKIRKKGIAIPSRLGRNQVSHPPRAAPVVKELTERQREIAERSAQGMSADDIAAELGIAPGTVRSVRTTLRARGYTFVHGKRGRRAAADQPRDRGDPEPPPPADDPGDAPADDAPDDRDGDDDLPPALDDEEHDTGAVMPVGTVQPPQRVAKPKPKFDTPAPPPVPPAEDHELAFVLAWLRDVAGVRVVDSTERPGTWDVGWSTQTRRAAQPRLPIDALYRYANDIRVKAGLAPFRLPGM